MLEKIVIRGIPFAAGLQWKFIGSIYFCTIVITTIGNYSLKLKNPFDISKGFFNIILLYIVRFLRTDIWGREIIL